MILKLIYDGIISSLEIDDNETVLTLKLLISEMHGIPIENLLVKTNDGIVLTNDRQKISTLSDITTHNLPLLISDLTEAVAIQKPQTNNPFMNISNMDLSSVKPLLKDKKFIKNMFENNPMFKKTLENNQEMKAMLNSGHLSDEIEKMIEDPEYMKEAMKNGELAMQKMENIPGGLSQINSYMEKVHDPLRSVSQKKNYKSRLEKDDFDKFRHLGIKNCPIKGNGIGFVKYINEINYLDEKGFKDFKRNLELLEIFNGDLKSVIAVYLDGH
ncbi:Ubiquitin domain-containing protein DSK2b [Cucumispora dikerogammari]|nr:Ubiquitin domain-containing protein DSK2b [Cucumispora dikerogammari]